MSMPQNDPFSDSEASHTVVRNVGKCSILAELGHGGMANVYLAVQRGQGGFNKLVVLKALRPELAIEPTLSMFLDEARVAAQLNHANVVQTYEVGSHNDRHVIVMEYLEGQSLSQVLRQAAATGRDVPLAMRLRVLINALEGLHYAHELRAYDGTRLDLVHRDVSPQNIFVTYTGHVKVLDFGIAKAASSSTQTEAGVVKGKLSYMSPEQLTGDSLDRRADVFSVGCILWSYATGRRLWHKLSDVQIMRKLWEGDIPSPRTENPEVDEEFARIIDKAMASDPSARYESALDLQTDLERYAETLGAPVKQKEIGALVSSLFETSRRELQQLIETQLKRLESGDDSFGGVPIVGVPDVNPSTTQRHQESSAFRWLPHLVILVLAAGLVGVLVQRELREERTVVIQQAPPTPKVPEPKPPESKPAPSLATIRFSVTPAEAELYFDGTQLAQGTLSKVVPADHAVHELRAEAEGYQAASVEFSANQDRVIKLELKETPRAPRVARRIRRAPKPALATPSATPSPTPSQPATKAPDCSNPFFIDAAGIKRVRNECR